MMKFEWELIYKKEETSKWLDATLRAKVIGGCLIRQNGVSTYENDSFEKFCYSTESSMIFVPDPNHEWVIDKI